MKAVGAYRIERLLGRGRQSAVYLAHDSRDGRTVALKVAERGAGLQHEYSVGRALRSRHSLALYDQGQEGHRSFLAMEYAPGGHAGQAGAPLAADRAFAYALQAAQALAPLHEAGWVHRDIKPANLLLRGDGSLVLADLGAACRRGEGRAQGQPTIVGTPRYAAPEQSRGAAAQPTADIYSLGVMLYEWLAGQPPFRGETPTELIAQHLLAEPPLLPAQHADWQALINMLLAKEPGLRLADGRALVQVLQQLEPLLLAPFALRDPS